MNWYVFVLPIGLLLFAIAVLLRRRIELGAYSASLAERSVAQQRGSHRARLQHPKVDLTKCIGCGACVRACPEAGVLALAYGQAVVVHGARCVGHGLCAAACPTAAIALTLGDLADRRDLPVVDDRFEAVGTPGLFLAGEITGFALVRTAIGHGAAVAREVAARMRAAELSRDSQAPLDLLVIGLGPAGLSCLLAAKEAGLRAMGIDQAAEIGGTVAAYPRQKLVMTQPMELPLHGKLTRTEYHKEELVELWRSLVAEHRLQVRTGTVLQRIERGDDGVFAAVTDHGLLPARHVCLAVGRRGSPQKLGVPGEELPKVSYSLLDAEGYRGRQLLVVGGGDSAIEAALALAEQPGNVVSLSYRKAAFSRLKARNEERILAAAASGEVRVLYETEVASIHADRVVLRGKGATRHGERGGTTTAATLAVPNDEVFVFAGGTPPFPLLEAAGVSFDPALRPRESPIADRGTGLLVALGATLAGLLGLLAWWLVRSDYYSLHAAERPGSEWHELLRPQSGIGLLAGIGAVALLLVNLLYLLRRSPRLGRWLPLSLKVWMSGHVATGLGACLLAILHSSFHAREGAGGHALLAMVVVVAAGIVGRYFYAFVPRAQNGRQQDFEELQSQVAALAGEWDEHGRGFGSKVRAVVDGLADGVDLGRGFLARAVGLVRSQLRLRRELERLRAEGLAEGIPLREIRHMFLLARRSHRVALQLVHFEEVRGLLSAWRYLHRWLAVLLTLLVIVHVVAALRYGGVDLAALPGVGGGR